MATRSFTLEVKENGRLVLPKALRAQLRLEPGDRLIVKAGDDGRAELMTARAALKSARGMFADIGPRDISLVDELIAERHAEAERE